MDEKNETISFASHLAKCYVSEQGWWVCESEAVVRVTHASFMVNTHIQTGDCSIEHKF